MDKEDKMKEVLHLGLSYSCNMKCKHCFVQRKKDGLCIEDFYHILDQAYELGVFVVYYTYGEPLLDMRLAKVSRYAKQKGFVQVLMTNGYYLGKEQVELIKKNRISKVCISLDHISEKRHDENRGINGAYMRAIKAIQRLVAEGIPVGISMTINDSNVTCMNEILQLGIKMGVKFISFLRERNIGICNLTDENRKIYETFFVQNIDNDKMNIHYHDCELIPVIKKLKAEKNIDECTYEKYYEMNRCHRNTTLSVSPDGKISNCNLCPVEIGDVKDTHWYENLEEKEKKYEYSVCWSTLS